MKNFPVLSLILYSVSARFLEEFVDRSYQNEPFSMIDFERDLKSETNSTDCDDGQILIGKCLQCPKDTYSVFNPTSKTCFECFNDTMNCTNNELKPRKNVFRFGCEDRSEKYLKIFRKCPEPGACKGYNQTVIKTKENKTKEVFNTTCGAAYKGKMCHSCNPRYTKTSLHTCAKCPDWIVNIIITLVIIFLVGVITYYLITTTLTVCFDPAKFHSVGLKIFINYIQVIYLCLQYRISWPRGIKEIVGSKSSGKANSLKYYYFSIKCLLNPDMDENNLFYYRVYFMVSLPVISLICSTICIIFINFFTKKEKRLKHYKSITIMVPFFLIYPYVLSYSLSPIACESLEQGRPSGFQELNEGESYPSYLIENRDIWCSEDLHRQKGYPATFIGLFIWGILVPGLIFLQLFRNRRNLHIHKIKYRYGFLFSGYLRKRYFWEFVIIGKKFILVVLTIIMQSDYDPTIQSLLLITSLLVFLVLHVHFNPYITKELNNLELLSSLAAIITILAGIILNESSKSKRDWLVVISSIVIIVINVWFLYIWVKFMFWKNVRELVDKYEFLKRFFNYSDGIDQQKLKEFEKVNYMYTEEMQTVYTQIKDIGKSDVVHDFNKSTTELMREIVKVEYNDYNSKKGPSFKTTDRRKSIYV